MDCVRRSDCRYCESRALTPILDLGKHPPSDSFISLNEITTEQRFPLELFYCEKCFLLQICDVVSPKSLFGGEFLYRASTSGALRRHYGGLTRVLAERFSLRAGDVVLDIGCNDGILLNTYEVTDLKTVGVEPSELAAEAADHGHRIFREFFDLECAKSVTASVGMAKVVTATNVFPHVDRIREFVLGVKAALSDEGVFVMEASYMPDFIDQTLFDTIYHEHLCYLNLSSLTQFLEPLGLEVFDVERVAVGASGPAVRVFAQLQGGGQEITPAVSDCLAFEEKWGVGTLTKYRQFADRVRSLRVELLGLLEDFKASGVEVAGYGAPAKGNTLLNYLGIDSSSVAYIADNNPLKQGKVTPGSHIPIVSDEEFLKRSPSHALLLAWNYLEFFLKNSQYIKAGGKFIVPLPRPEILP